MSLITLIAVNAVLGGAVVGGLLVLLGRGILGDRDANRTRRVAELVELVRLDRAA